MPFSPDPFFLQAEWGINIFLKNVEFFFRQYVADICYCVKADAAMITKINHSFHTDNLDKGDRETQHGSCIAE